MKWVTVGLALAAASAFAIAVQAGMWWSVGEVTIGPFGARNCFSGDCDLRWIGGSDLWMRSAIATGVAGALSSFLLIVVAGAVAAGRTPKLLARMSLASIVTAIACATYFVVQFPGVQGAEVGRGGVIFTLGIVLGIPAAIRAMRESAPAK